MVGEEGRTWSEFVRTCYHLSLASSTSSTSCPSAAFARPGARTDGATMTQISSQRRCGWCSRCWLMHHQLPPHTPWQTCPLIFPTQWTSLDGCNILTARGGWLLVKGPSRVRGLFPVFFINPFIPLPAPELTYPPF